MFAIIELGNQQFKVEEGSIIDCQKIDTGTKKTLSIDNVLLISDDKTTTIGQPTVKGAKVTAEVLNQHKDNKILVFKFKRKTGYKVTQGHRQELTTLKIKKITKKSASTDAKKEGEEN